MNRLFILLSITLLALWYANYTSVEERNQPILTTSRDHTRLAPNLIGASEKVRRFEISKEGSPPIIVELDPKDTIWKVKSHNRYPAKKSLILKWFNDLSESVLLEEKTSNPELWENMHLDQKQAIRIKLIGDEPNKPILDVYIGEFKAPLGGTYIRHARDKQTWLASGEFTPELKDTYWLSQEVFSVDQRRLRSVHATHISASGVEQTIKLEKESPFKEFDLKDLPAWSHAQNYYNAMMLPAAFEDLVLSDVIPSRSVEGRKSPYLKVTAETFDGLVLSLDFVGEDDRWAYIRAGYDPAKRWVAPPKDPKVVLKKPLPIKGYDSDVDKDSNGYDTLDGMDEYFMLPEETVKTEVEKINNRTSKWAYLFAAYKYSMFSRSPESILGANPELVQRPEEETDPANSVIPIQPPKLTDSPELIGILKSRGMKNIPKDNSQKTYEEQKELMELFKYEPLIDKKLKDKLNKKIESNKPNDKK